MIRSLLMSLRPGTRLGPYEISSAVGAGGMGEVYRARDTALNRDVAVKVLPDLFASDPERLTRFTREAQTLAALSHTNIAHVYGVVDGALVMEFADGEDLSAIIARGPLPPADALPIARQIADALEAAHEYGIVHRDLKPANVKVAASGTVKVLDFGLAKAMDPPSSAGPEGPAYGAASNAMNSPTFTAHARLGQGYGGASTELGVVLGTAAYMAPEQARGRIVDKRADIWAFGVVLFEMLAGRRPFDDEDVSGVMARVLERDPDWALLPAALPATLRTLIERCLAKDPKARLRDIGDARHTLDEIIAGRSGSLPASATRVAASASGNPGRNWLPWAVAGALGVMAAAGWLRPSGVAAGPRRTTQVELALPDNVEFYTTPRISADGRRIAFFGVREGSRSVFVRDLDHADTRAVPGTEGGIFVTISPDGESIATISTDGKVRRIALGSGTVEEIASGADIVGGLQWTSQGTILFGGVTRILGVPAAGGAAREIVAITPGETSISNPAATPDGRTVLFTAWGGKPGAQRSRIDAVPMAGGERRVIVEDGAYVLAAMADRLLFQRRGSIYSVPFDPVQVRVTGAATKLTDIARESPTGGVAADVTPGGDLLFAGTQTFNGRLAWVSVDGGTERGIQVPSRTYNNPRVSPDGHTVAYSDASAIWTTDTERGAQSRIFTGNDALTGFPIWSPDGKEILFRTSSGIVRMRADGEGQPQLIPGTIRSDYPNAVSSDGTTLLMTRITAQTSGDIVLIPTTGGDPTVIVSTPGYDGGGQFSPDGRWVSYVSNVSGRMEVYLRPVDGPERHAVSTSGGMGALWSPDGKRIFFRNGLQFFAVDVTTGPQIVLSPPKLLFEHPYSFGPNITIANYSLSRDGRNFLVVDTAKGHLSLIFNWLQPDPR